MLFKKYFSGAVLLILSIQTFGADKITIGILDLQARGVSQTEAISLTSRIRNELFLTDRFTIVERERIDAVLAEQGIQQSGCTSSECIIQLGQILNVQHMIAGSVDRLENLYTINLRMIDIETGKIVSLASVDREGTIKEVALKSAKEVVVDLLNEYDRGVGESEVVYKSRKVKPAVQKDYRNKKWRFGIMGGYTPSDLGISADNFGDFNSYDVHGIHGGCFGFSVIRKWKKSLDIQVEILFIDRRDVFDISLNDGSDINGFAHLTQIELPITFKWGVFSGKSVNTNILIGIGLIGQDHSMFHYIRYQSFSTTGYDGGLQSELKPSIVVGAGFDYFLNPFLITLDLRFSYAEKYDVKAEMTSFGVTEVLWDGSIYYTTFCMILGIYL